MMTSRSGEDDIVAGPAAGADDYMIKPIRRAELVARVCKALLRRYIRAKTTRKAKLLALVPTNLMFAQAVPNSMAKKLS